MSMNTFIASYNWILLKAFPSELTKIWDVPVNKILLRQQKLKL
jgi:hypothetical protein